jgi:hypothetical protein
MKITTAGLLKFLVEQGAAFDLTFEDIEFVGIENILQDASTQIKAKTAFSFGTKTSYELHTDEQEALADYFGDGGFSGLYDAKYQGDLDE